MGVLVNKDTKVSMNMIAFVPNFLNFIDKYFEDFLKNSNLEKDEYLIPDVVMRAIETGSYDVKVIDTDAKWVGVTYKEDKDSVVEYINKLIEKGEYKNNLWS